MMRPHERGVTHTTEVPAVDAGSRPLPVAAWAAGAALLALAAAFAYAGHRQLAGLVNDLDRRTLDSAPRLLETAIAQRKAEVLAEVRLLSEDTRVRTTVMTAQFSETTVRDILNDLREATGAAVMAVVDTRGKVRAVAGKEGLHNLDLAGTPLVTEGLARTMAQVWTLPDQVLVVGVAPVRAGGQVAALFLTGRELTAATLNPIEQAVGVSSAVLVRQAIVARSAGAAPLDALIKAAADLQDGRPHLLDVGGQHLVTVSSTSPSAGAGRVVWALPRGEGQDRLVKLQTLAWAPLPLVALSLALAFSLFRRRS